jgi:hypothetical protein
MPKTESTKLENNSQELLENLEKTMNLKQEKIFRKTGILDKIWQKIAQIKLIKNFLGNAFLKDTGGIFLISITVSLLNYLIIIQANRVLVADYELWNTLASLTVVLAAPLAGFSMEIMKKTAILKKESFDSAFTYYHFLRRKVFHIIIILILLSPLLTLPLQIYLLHPTQFGNPAIWLSYFGMETLVVFLVILQAILAFLFTINQYFFLGIMDLGKYAFTAIGQILGRFLIVILFLPSWGILALPLAIVLSNGFIFFVVEIWLWLENQQFRAVKGLSFSFKEESWLMAKSSVIGFFLTAYFDLSTVLSRNFFTEKSVEANLYATINIFGKITYFGTSAMLGGLIVHAISDIGQKTYKKSLLLITVVSTVTAIGLYLLSPFILTNVLKRPEFVAYNYLIFLVVGYVAFYTIIYASVNYSVARSQYKLANFVIILAILLYVSLIYLNSLVYQNNSYLNSFWQVFALGGSQNSVLRVLLTNLFVAIFGAILYIFIIIFGQKFNNLKPLQNTTLKETTVE